MVRVKIAWFGKSLRIVPDGTTISSSGYFFWSSIAVRADVTMGARFHRLVKVDGYLVFAG